MNNPPRLSRKKWSHSRKKERQIDEDGGDRIECSGRSCRSCTAALIADCVALCCCPCAVVNFLAFAFVKVPWAVGRKCLGIGKRKRKRLENKRKCKKGDQHDSGSSVVERERWWTEEVEGIMDISSSSEDKIDCVSARFEAERVWLELYQVGHLGFGRVSFTGIQPQGKGN